MEKIDKKIYNYLTDPVNDLFNKIRSIGTYKGQSIIPVFDEINLGFNKLNKLINLIENMNQDVSFEGILNYIYSTFSEFIPYNHIGIALLKDDGKVLEASYGISDVQLEELPKKLVGIRAEVSKTSMENIVKYCCPRIINDLEEYVVNKDVDYNKLLLQFGIKSSITLPLKVHDKPIGIIFFSNTKRNAYNENHIEFLMTLSNSIAICLNKNIFIDEMLYSTLLALTKMAEARDEETAEHLDRMAAYSVKITEFLLHDRLYCDQLTVPFLKGIERFSPMHDIGKVGIKDGILLKPGKLTEEEFNEMKKHVTYGADVLRTAESNIEKQKYSMFKMGIEIVEGHHEWWDGSGYPYKRKGYEIPLSARIVTVADVFDALTSKRPYKEAYSFEESINKIIEERGRHFDPHIIDSVSKHMGELYELYLSFHQ